MATIYIYTHTYTQLEKKDELISDVLLHMDTAMFVDKQKLTFTNFVQILDAV